MSFLGNSFKLRSKTETDEARQKREARETKVTIYAAGLFLALASLFGFYITFSEGIMSEDFSFFLIGSIVVGALAFLCLSPWKRTNYLIGGILVSSVGVWLFLGLFDYENDDYWTSIIWTIVFGLWGASLLAKARERTLSGIIKDFFQLNAVRTTGTMIKQLFKFAFWLGMVALIVWLIVALGPLWIIAIILLLIFFVLANR